MSGNLLLFWYYAKKVVQLFPLIPILNSYGSHIITEVNIGTKEVQYLYHLGAFWVPIMYLEIVTFPGLFQFYLRVPYIRIYYYSYRILPTWDLYGSYMGTKKAYMGPM